MDETQRQILKMLADGAISAADADRLLAAIGASDSAPEAPHTPETPEVDAPLPADEAADAAPTDPEAAQRILQMLQDGALSAAEADRLLAAMDPSAEAQTGELNAVGGVSQISEVSDTGPEDDSPPPFSREEVSPPPAPPDMERFRRLWQIPFIVALGFLIVSGLCMSATYGSFWFVCGWSVFIVAALAVAIAFWSRTATWVHVRIREAEGNRIAVSLPVPLRLMGWLLPLVRRFVPAEEAEHLDTAAEFLEAIQDEMRQPGASPLVVDVNDDDGDQVQVYLG